MIEKKTGRPALFADCDGTGNYDQGESQAFLALMKEFASEKPAEPGEHFTGVLGATPMDLGDIDAQAVIRPMLEKRGIKKAYIYTMGAGLSEIGSAGRADLNIVISPAALGAARYLKEKFNTPYEEDFPLEAIPDLDRILEECRDRSAGRILIVAEQMLANALRKRILVGRDQNPPLVRAASWFMMDDEFTEEGDLHIDSEYEWKKIAEEGGWDIIIGDSLFARAAAYEGKYLDLPHFAVSGKF